MSLTPKQKEIIKSMQEGTSLYTAGDKIAMTDFTFPTRKTFERLLAMKLIKRYGKTEFYNLTELGKKIKL